MGAEGGDRGSGGLEDAGRGAFAAGVTGFLDDLATVFASWIAAAPRAWAALAFAVVTVSAWVDSGWLPETAVIAGCLVARVLPRRIPAAAALVAVLIAVLTFVSDTLAPEVRDVLVIAAPATAGAVVAAWATGLPGAKGRWTHLVAPAVALLVTALGRAGEANQDPAWAAAVPAGAAATALVAGTSVRWAAAALFAVTLALAHTTSWIYAPFGLVEGCGAALLVAITARAARGRTGTEATDGESASGRIATRVRRWPLAAGLVVAAIAGWMDPLLRWILDVFVSIFERGGPSLAAMPWPAGWSLFPLLAAHIVALGGLAAAIRRASVVAGVNAVVWATWALMNEFEAGGTAGMAWVAATATDAAAGGVLMISAAVLSWGTSERRPGSVFRTTDAVVVGVAVAAQAARIWFEVTSQHQHYVTELLLGAALYRVAMTRTRLSAVVVGAAAAASVVTAVASIRSTDPDWLAAVAVVTSASFVRVVLFVAILRRIRSLTPVPADHRILADYGTDLRVRAAVAAA